jgi:hypothetical protein
MTIGSSFTKKQLIVTFVLKDGTFDGTNNTKIIQGLRIHCSVDKQGEPSKNKMKLKVYGMSTSDMNVLTIVPGQSAHALQVFHSIVKIEATEEGSSIRSLVYQGDVTESFASYHQPPNLHFAVESLTGYFGAIAPVKPTSYKGGADVATIMQGLATQLGYGFQNNGVNVQINNPYLCGSALSQASAIANAANIEFGIDDDVMFIAPTGKERAGTAPLINAQTGLHEYPTFDKKGIKFKCLYTPGLKLGGLVNVQSSLFQEGKQSTWRINGLKQELTCLEPSAKWESHVTASWVGN